MAARGGSWLDRATRVALLSMLAIQSASPLTTLAGQGATVPGEQSFPERLPGYATRQRQIAVSSYEDSQPASLLLALGTQGAMASASGRVVDENSTTHALQRAVALRLRQNAVARASLDTQDAPNGILLAGLDAINPGESTQPDRLPGYAPRQARVAQTSEDVQPPLLGTTLGAATPAPFYGSGSYTWPDWLGTLWRRARYLVASTSEDSQPASLLLTLASQDSIASAAGRYPDPDTGPALRTRAERLRQYTAATTSDGQDSLLGTLLFSAPADPLRPSDWPLPNRPPLWRAAVNRGLEVNPLLSTLAGQDVLYGAPGEVPAYTWPVPPGPRRPVQPEIPPSLLGTLLFVVPPVPVLPFDWPNPNRPQLLRSVLNRGQETGLVLTTLAGQDAIASAAHRVTAPWTFPLPSRRGVPFDPPNLQGTTLFVLPPAPIAPLDWPVPLGRAYPLANRTHAVALVTGTLLGQDRFYGAAGQSQAVDWTQHGPPLAAVVTPRRAGLAARIPGDGQAASPLRTLRGQDRVYAGPGQVPVYTWTVPLFDREIRRHERRGIIGPLGVPIVILITQTAQTVAAGTLVAGGRATLLAAAPPSLTAVVGADIAAPARGQTLTGPSHPTLETGA